MQVIKNDKIFPYDRNRVRNAVIQSFNQIEFPDFEEIDVIIDEIEDLIWTKAKNDQITNKEIENLTMSVLYREAPAAAREYSTYKIHKEEINKNPSEIDKVLYVSDEVDKENANKNPVLAHIQNSYLAEISSKEEMRKALPKDCLDAHDRGVVYFHDMAYSIRSLHNCELLNLDALLQDGCLINNTWVEKPKSFQVACTVTTQILTHVASNTYGGCTINLLHLAKFVDVSRQRLRKEIEKEVKLMAQELYNDIPVSPNNVAKLIDKITEQRLKREIEQGMQTFTYQNQTLCSNVGQAVFLTVSVYLNEDPKYTDDLILIFEEMLRQRIQGVKNKDGIYENPNFPKILYMLDENTMRGGKYYETTKLCAICSAKRLVPDYMSVKKHMELKGVVTPSMGCRALLSPYKDEQDQLITWGRFNCGVSSLNLPYIAMENNPDCSEEILFDNLKYYLNISNRNLIWRVNHVAKIKAEVCPVLWQCGGLAKLQPKETLENLVYGGYATVTTGYSGLHECVKYITGENHWEGNGKKLAHKILDFLNQNNKELGENIGVSVALYATPAETLTDKFAKACIRDFGTVDGAEVRNYETNGYHVPVFQEMDAFTKLTTEAQFSDKTLGGSISYVEVPNISNNIEAMLELIEHIGNECLYAEINSEVSICSSCGFEGYDFNKIYAEDGTVRWKCPACGETDPEKVKTSYRICGYISNYVPNQGRSEDIMNRVKHLN